MPDDLTRHISAQVKQLKVRRHADDLGKTNRIRKTDRIRHALDAKEHAEELALAEASAPPGRFLRRSWWVGRGLAIAAAMAVAREGVLVVVSRPEVTCSGLRALPEAAVLHRPGSGRQVVVPTLLDAYSGRRSGDGRLGHLDHGRTGQRDPYGLLTGRPTIQLNTHPTGLVERLPITLSRSPPAVLIDGHPVISTGARPAIPIPGRPRSLLSTRSRLAIPTARRPGNLLRTRLRLAIPTAGHPGNLLNTRPTILIAGRPIIRISRPHVGVAEVQREGGAYLRTSLPRHWPVTPTGIRPLCVTPCCGRRGQQVRRCRVEAIGRHRIDLFTPTRTKPIGPARTGPIRHLQTRPVRHPGTRPVGRPQTKPIGHPETGNPQSGPSQGGRFQARCSRTGLVGHPRIGSVGRRRARVFE